MENIEDENKSINNLSKDAVDGRELKGGGTPGWVDPMETGDAGWILPVDESIHVQNGSGQIENQGLVTGADNSDPNGPVGSAVLNPLLTPTNNPSI